MSEDLVQARGTLRHTPGGTLLGPWPVAELTALLAGQEHAFQEKIASLTRAEMASLFTQVRYLYNRQEERIGSVLKIGSELRSTIHRDELLDLIMAKITRLMNAERSTLLLVDPQTGALRSRVTQGMANVEIVLQVGQGVAGWVAQTGQSINIRDAYRDPRFDSSVDNQSGFRTHSIVCQPLRNLDGQIIGVVQVLNSRSGFFSDEDENLLSAIATQAAVAIENSTLYLSVLEKNDELLKTKEKLEHRVAELDLLVDIQRHLGRPNDLDSLVETITKKTLELINGAASALTLNEEEHHRMFVMIDRGQGERKWDFYTRNLTVDEEITRRVIETGEPFICRGGACRLVPGATSEETSLEVFNVIAVPLFDQGKCIGALEVFNLELADSPGEYGFTDDDVKVLTLIASQIASTVATRRLQDAQEKEDRLATIGQMISGILHDFKTPFAIISGYVQLMADTDNPQTRKEFAESTLKQFRQLNQMTLELLRFARGDTNILLRKVFIHEFMEEVRELLTQELNDRNVELFIELDYRAGARLDSVKMKRAILNLARNAADSMTVLEGDSSPAQFRIRVRHDEEAEELVFSFSDTGLGIPFEVRENLFESFVTSGKSDGTGLGLAVVKKIVTDHQGNISFDTRLGQGTTFHIRIPHKS